MLFPAPVDLDRILANSRLDGAVVSAVVTDMDGRILYEHNSSFHVVPASNQKLLSNSFALWELGADYRPVTRFWKLDRRIVIDSPGDPLNETMRSCGGLGRRSRALLNGWAASGCGMRGLCA